MSTSVMRSRSTLRRALVLAGLLLLSVPGARALSCVSPDEIIQRTLQVAEPPFSEADVVIYGKVIELLPDDMAKAGIKSLIEGSSLARVRVIESFRGAAAGRVLVFRTDDRVAGNAAFTLSNAEQLIVAEGGVVAPCLMLQPTRAQLVDLRRHFEQYPTAAR